MDLGSPLDLLLQPAGISASAVGIVVVDHGSRRTESNELLLEVVDRFARSGPFSIVEPAHMELAEPSLATAFGRCVQRGAQLVVIHPYFLLPGRHWDQDIPALAAQAARAHPDVRFLVTAPLGLHPLMLEVMRQRIEHCLARTLGDGAACAACEGTQGCTLRPVRVPDDGATGPRPRGG